MITLAPIFEDFQDFSVIQILRETNFRESKSLKTPVLAIFGARNFGNLGSFSLQKVYKFIKIKIQSLKKCKNCLFLLSIRTLKIDCT